MRALTPRQIDQRLGRLEAQAKSANASTGYEIIHLHEGEDEPPEVAGINRVVIRWVSPNGTAFQLPHNGREALGHFSGSSHDGGSR